MPRADRLKKNTVKQPLNVAKAPGQASLVAFLKSPASDKITKASVTGGCQSYDTDEAEAHVVDAPGPSAVCVSGDPWIKTRHEFTDHDMVLSENKGRYCQAEWFADNEWMWYYREKRSVFCGVCIQYKQQKDTSPFMFSDSAGVIGFRNWKKGVERLSEHKSCCNHINADNTKRKIHRSITRKMDKQVNELQKQRRQGLAHVNTLKTILRRGTAVRGHTDDDSNIVQFNKDKATDNPDLTLFLAENQYMGHEIQTNKNCWFGRQDEVLLMT